jgi:hypothetical protein
MLATQAPFPQYFDIDGDPLDAGYLYFGAANQNPETTPIGVYWDAAGTQPAAQPVRTLNGYAARNGTPALLYVASDYSINVRDKKGQLIYYSASAAGFSNALALQLQLADTAATAPPLGANLSGFKGSLNYTGLTVGARLLDIGASPRSLGAVGDGVNDDTAFIQAALLYSKTLDLRNRSWKITSTIVLPAGCTIDMRGATITLACGATPGFNFINGNAGLTILGGGGLVQGVASSFLFLQGKTTTPALQSDYASIINLYGVQVSSPTITTSVVMDKAVKSFNAWGCNFFSPNGVNSNAASVEINFTDCIIYSATGVAGTVGVKNRSPGGGAYYSQGWNFKGCTVDNFEITFDVTDMFAFQVGDSYIGSALVATTGYAFQFQAPTTALCDTITIEGCIIAGRIRFVAAAGGQAYNAKITGFVLIGVAGVAIALENNTANVAITDGKFKAGSGTAIGIVGTNNNANIVCSLLEYDGTYANGVILNGANGANCLVGPLSGTTTGDIVGAGRGNIRFVGIPIHSTGVASLVRQSIASNISGAFAVAATIGSLALALPKGARGRIVINLPYSGANAATQNVQVNPPAGVNLIGGSGYSAQNLYLGAATGLVHAHLDFYCTADISGTLNVINQAGNALTINNQAYIALVLDS